MIRSAAPLRNFLWFAALLVCFVSVWQLEVERASVDERVVQTGAGPVTFYEPSDNKGGSLVVVAHGFAGSVQMMQYLSRHLARAGFTVAAFDFIGHGRSGELLSPDVSRIEGTTQQLVQQTQDVVAAAVSVHGNAQPIALLGHSMATDIIIRAAEQRSDVAAIIAISMYSEAITPDFPKHLLMIAGAWEGRLRDAGLSALAQITDAPAEGVTFRDADVTRRAVSIAGTEHVAVLFSPVTALEAQNWLESSLGSSGTGEVMPRGYFVVGLLASLVVLTWPLARLLPAATSVSVALGGVKFWTVVFVPAVPAIAATCLSKLSVFGLAGFGTLTLFFAVWGWVALGLLWWMGRSPRLAPVYGGLLLCFWALVVFAVALDRYAAAFLPVGPRVPLWFVLLVGTVPFAWADRLLVDGASLWRRFVARAVVVAALVACMMFGSGDLGLLFSVVAVLALFYLIYGSMISAVAMRTGPDAVAPASGVILAWSIAASTPLFQTLPG